MSDCTENFLIWTLIIVAILSWAGFGKLPLLLFVLPIALIAAYVLTRFTRAENKLTVGTKNGSLEKH